MSRVTPGAIGNFSSTPSGTQDVNLTQVGGVGFSLGQQLAALSLPIVLTAAQLTTLTPPAAITGFATSAKQDTIIGHLDGVESSLTTIIGHVDGIEGLLGGTLTVQATNLDIRDLVQTQDNIRIWGNTVGDGTGTNKVIRTDSDGDVLIHVPDAANGQFGNTDAQSATLTSYMFMVELFGFNGSTWDRLRSDIANGLDVDVTRSALPSGASTLAEQQTQTASLSVIDDWDESDRAKVNIIVGQAGITAGAGAVAVNTPRVTLSSDDPAVVALQILDNAISGSEMQVDVVGALPAGTNNIGKVDHVISGIGHGVKTVTTAGTDVALSASQACKKVVIQAQTDNTGLIAVGATGVDATIATGTGIVLTAGDVFVLQIDNLEDIFIDSTVSGEGVRYTYFT